MKMRLNTVNELLNILRRIPVTTFDIPVFVDGKEIDTIEYLNNSIYITTSNKQ